MSFEHNLAIIIFSHIRSNYLFITMDSLFRNKHIEKYPVFVSVDGNAKSDEMRDIINYFPVNGYFIRENPIGSAQAYGRGIQALCDLGYDYVMFIEEDELIKSTMLDWVQSHDIDTILSEHIFINFSYDGGERAISHYRGHVSIVKATNFNNIYSYCINKEYIGKPTAAAGRILNEYAVEDGMFSSYIRYNNLTEWTAGDIYCAHIGIRGTTNKKLSPEAERLETYLFSGPREKWLLNAASLFHHDFVDPILVSRLIPKGFVYE